MALDAPARSGPVVAPTAIAVAQPTPTAEPVVLAQAEPAPAPTSAMAPVKPTVSFAAAREVVQAIPAAVIAATGLFKTPIDAAPARVAAAKPTKPLAKVVAPAPAPAATAGGAWFVQLGAFDNAGVAKDAWGRATRRYAAFKGHVPQGTSFRTASAIYYRLSVGGFSRAQAGKACRAYRARGGDCFVRAGAGDQIASWVKPGVRLAAVRKTGARG